jgi:hypothetical protein
LAQLKVVDVLGRTVLVARETARQLNEPIAAALTEGARDLELDLKGVLVISPSFFDELLGGIAPALRSRAARRLILANSPVDLTEFQTIGKTYSLGFQRRKDRWFIEPSGRRTGSPRR